MQAGVEVRNTFVFLWPNTNLQIFYDLIIISCETSKKKYVNHLLQFQYYYVTLNNWHTTMGSNHF